MLSYPLGVAMTPQVLANDLLYYDALTDPNGPAMTWALFAIGWFNAGNYTKAAPHFIRGFANVQVPPLLSLPLSTLPHLPPTLH
jgi:hypothetical protein